MRPLLAGSSPGTLALGEAKADNATHSIEAPPPSLIFHFRGLCHAVCRILVPQPGITPVPPVSGVQS